MNAAPLLVSFSSLEDYVSALGEQHRDKYRPSIKRLVESGFPPVVSAGSLAVLFGFSTKFIYTMALQNTNYYRSFTIRKGSKIREIKAPKVSIKVIQKWFGYHLARGLDLPDEICGFVAGRSVLTAARKHINARWVYSVDIKDFFQTTPHSLVKKSLKDIGYPDSGAELISSLSCYGEYLAQGSPASPVLANLAMKSVDDLLINLAREKQIRFSRYADDIVFSGIDLFPEDLPERITAIFEGSPWSLSVEKQYKSVYPSRLLVHGLLVHGDRPRLTKSYRNKVRAFRHLQNKGGISPTDIARVSGHISYADYIDTCII